MYYCLFCNVVDNLPVKYVERLDIEEIQRNAVSTNQTPDRKETHKIQKVGYVSKTQTQD